MFDYSYIVGPAVGAVIGYITNALAIRMLFRPYTAKYIFGVKIPFTPGIIPKEKGRIAQSLGGAISENLMNREVLEKTLLSEEMMEKLGNGFDRFTDSLKSNDEPLGDYLLRYVSREDLEEMKKSTVSETQGLIASKLTKAELGGKIAHVAVDHVFEKMDQGLIGLTGAVKLMRPLAVSVENLLAKNIDDIIETKGSDIVNELISAESENLLSCPVRRLMEGKDEQIRRTRAMLMDLYSRLIREQLPRILATINIPSMIEGRVNEMDMAETERLIFKVMDKELRAIVWLGAGLGAIMGTLNCLI